VTAYTVGLYIHFLINLSVAIYLLFVILHATNTDTVALCRNVLQNQQAKNQCDSLFDSIRGLYAGLASFVLVVELCEWPDYPAVSLPRSFLPSHLYQNQTAR